MRILHTESSLGWGGQEMRVLGEARGVARLGHEVLLAAPAESRIHAEAPRFGLTCVALPIGRKNLSGVLAVRCLLRDRAFDVVNTHSSTDSWLAALACATLGRSPAIVRTRHISAPVPRNAATRWLYRQAREIATTGERLRLQVIDEAGVDARRVTSVPTGIDLERFQPGEARVARAATGLPEGLVIGIVATLRSWKGHLDLLEAFARLARPHATLAIVGDGPMRAALEARVAALGLGGRVRFAGNRDDVVPWLQSFDIFCLPSYANEGVPQALMQAMACGLPVVTTGVGSIGEIAEDGRTARVVPPRDVEALRAALEGLAGDERERESLGESALAGRERFGEARMTRAMLELFARAKINGVRPS